MARVVLGFAITQQWFPGQWKVQVIGLVIGLESGLGAPAGQSSAAGTVGPLPTPHAAAADGDLQYGADRQPQYPHDFHHRGSLMKALWLLLLLPGISLAAGGAWHGSATGAEFSRGEACLARRDYIRSTV